MAPVHNTVEHFTERRKKVHTVASIASTDRYMDGHKTLCSVPTAIIFFGWGCMWGKVHLSQCMLCMCVCVNRPYQLMPSLSYNTLSFGYKHTFNGALKVRCVGEVEETSCMYPLLRFLLLLAYRHPIPIIKPLIRLSVILFSNHTYFS